MRILTGIDVNVEKQEWLVHRAARFAARTRGKLDLVYIGANKPSEAELAVRKLQELMQMVPEPCRGEVAAEAGDPVTYMLEKSTEYTALVVGPREPGGLERMLRGSSASRIIRQAHCACFIPRGDKPEGNPFRIVIGVHIHVEQSSWLVQQAGVWGRRCSGKVDAVYVDANRLPYIADAKVRERAKREWYVARAPERRALQGLLKQVEDKYRGAPRIAQGQPETAIEEMSPEYDLVLVGNLKRSGMAGYILNSVADHVILNSSCDVLTLPTAHHLTD